MRGGGGGITLEALVTDETYFIVLYVVLAFSLTITFVNFETKLISKYLNLIHSKLSQLTGIIILIFMAQRRKFGPSFYGMLSSSHLDKSPIV